MSDYIKKSDAIKLYKEYQPTMAINVIEFGEALADIPSADVVEVVRCRECKDGDTGIDEEGKKFWKCLGIHYGGTNPDDFCSYGERRSDE